MKIISKKSKYLIITLMCMLSLLMLSCITAAAEDLPTSGKWGDNITWELDADGTLTLSGKGKMEYGAFMYNDELPADEQSIYPWSYYHKQIKKIIIGEGITEISDNAFHNTGDEFWTGDTRYTQLKTVKLPSTLKSIGKGAFYGACKLKQINFPDNLEKIGSYAFTYCWNLKKVVLPKGVKVIKKHTFDYCKKLSYIEMPSVEKIESHAFFWCESLTEITFPKTLKRIGYAAFSKCNKLTSVTLPSSLEKIGDLAFCDCASLEKVIFEENEYKNFEFGIQIFKDCTALSDVILPQNITNLYKTFQNCSSLKEVKLPKSATTLTATFYGCSSLEKITIPANVKAIDKGLFKNCKNLKKIVFKTEKLNFKNTTDKNSLFNGISENAVITLPVKKYSSYKKLIKPLVPKSVTFSTGGKWGDNITWKINSNGTLTLSGKGEMQRGIISYDIEAPAEDLDFYPWTDYCAEIKKIVIKEGITGIADNAFVTPSYGNFPSYEYKKLRTVKLPSTLKYIGRAAFSGCRKLKQINFPKGLEKIGNTAFAGCVSLEKVILPSSVKIIRQNAFKSCKKLSYIEMPGVEKIEKYAFFLCESLTDLKMPKKLKTIGRRAFQSCIKLTNITLPATVEKIGDCAFKKCTSLKKVIFKESKTENIQLGRAIFYGINKNAVFTLPSSSYKDYKTAIAKSAPKTVKYKKAG